MSFGNPSELWLLARICFCILEAIKNRSRGRPGNEARVYQLVEYGPAVGLGTRVFAPVSDFTQMDCRVLHVTYPVSRPVSFSCQV